MSPPPDPAAPPKTAESGPAVWAACLAAAPVFAGLPPEEMDWLAGRATPRQLENGESLLEAGADVEDMVFVCQGELQTALTDNGAGPQATPFSWHEGQLLGLMPYSRLERASQTILADGPVVVLTWRADEIFDEMICQHGAITRALVHQMLDRSRQSTRSQEQADRLAELGKVSAMLAHEMGNPISAVVSSGRQLDLHRQSEPERIGALARLGVEASQITPLLELLTKGCALGRDGGAPRVSAFALRQAEGDLADYLDSIGMADPDEAAFELAQARISVEQLEHALEPLPGAARAPLIGWAVGQLLSDRLIHEVLEASDRITSLIQAISGYVRMDRGQGSEEVDLRTGLKATLRLLDHKARDRRIEIVHDWPDIKAAQGEGGGLPKVMAGPSLQQVWMNIAQNALDALAELPDGAPRRLTVSILAPAPPPEGKGTHDGIEVRFTDNGPGIPEAIARRIFDPFFTTKAAGHGQGLGLDITRGVVETHQGWIGFDSSPGEGTTFRVWLPTVS